MATAPTNAEIQDYIFDYIRQSARQPREGEIAADVMQVQIYLDRNYSVRAKEYEAALNDMINNGDFTYSGGKFLIITAQGFAKL